MKLERKCLTCGNIIYVKPTYVERKAKCKICKGTTHALEENRLYYIWKSMIRRCTNPKDASYHQYGGIGVTVHETWLRTPENFYKWAIANNYTSDLFLDKDIICNTNNINPHRYGPDTCQFIDRTSNNQKTRLLKKGNTSGYRGITFSTLTKSYPWQAKICVNNKRINLGTWRTKLEAAKAYDYYITINKLLHTKNGVLIADEVVDIDKAIGRVREDSISGVKGIRFRKDTEKWTGYVVINGSRKSIGCHNTLEEAMKAQTKAAEI